MFIPSSTQLQVAMRAPDIRPRYDEADFNAARTGGSTPRSGSASGPASRLRRPRVRAGACRCAYGRRTTPGAPDGRSRG